MAKKESVKKNIFPFPYIFFALSIVLTVSIILCGYYGWFKIPASLMSMQKVTDLVIKNNSIESDLVQPEETVYMYKKDPAVPGAEYFEDLVKINEQNCYISGSIEVDTKNPPAIILYSHGSTLQVLDEMKGPFMEDMREYAEYFSTENYIFAASNQHGDNWGDKVATDDTEALLDYIKETYQTNGNVYLIGYSMGGLVTMNFASANTDVVKAVALLAPTSYSAEYDQERVDGLEDIDIKIWHGNRDVNIDISISERLVDRFELLGRELDLEVIEGGTHWDVDTELKDEILEHFDD